MTHSQSSNLDYQSLLKNAVVEIRNLRQELEAMESQVVEPIAIIGLGCRFPGEANTPEAFWQLLEQGVDAVREVPPQRWDVDVYYDPDPDALGKIYTRNGGFLTEDISLFDPQFFGISPREAIDLDPQQRLLLEVSWEALENAAIAPDSLKGSLTGVFVGICFDDYGRLTVDSRHPELINAYSGLGSAKSIAAGRIAYILDLQGPTMQVDTACSSSLLSVHLACQSLRSKESNLALAGGVNLILNPEGTISFCRLKALSPDGRCKTFDASADGYGRGEGCGMVVLKRLSDAIADQDNILAVIRGSAVNHDGYSNGLTAPNGQAQEKLVRQAFKNAQIEPNQIQYIETQGTGTSLGDPIEINALGRALELNSESQVLIGSVKSNIGHLEGSAGIASLIKVVLSLQHQAIPPNLHFNTPNPYINWQQLPFTVPTQLTPWPEKNGERIASINAYGMSGTNVHVIVGNAPTVPKEIKKNEYPKYLFCLSATDELALRELAQKYAQWLMAHPDERVDNLCYTTQVGRSHFEYRLAIMTESIAHLLLELEKWLKGEFSSDIMQGQVDLQKIHELEKSEENVINNLNLPTDLTEYHQFITRLGELYVQGFIIDWYQLYKDSFYQKIGLPTYAFQRQRYWVETTRINHQGLSVIGGEARNWTEDFKNNDQIDWKQRIRDSSPEDCLSIVNIYLKENVAHILKLDSSQISESKSLNQLGFDSLMSMELKNKIKKDFGVTISFTKFMEGVNLQDIVRDLSHQLDDSESESFPNTENPIKSVSRNQNYPLSFFQRQLWLLSQLEVARSAYTIPVILNWRGNLDLNYLRESLKEIVKRHESFRTVFGIVDGNPVQHINDHLTIDVKSINLTSFPEIEQQENIKNLINQQVKQILDSTQLPLLRLTVVQTSLNDHVLIFTIHHLVCDGWSIGIFFQELAIIYRHLIKTQTYLLPDLPIQYVDFTVWQNQTFRRELIENDLQFWKQKLANVPKLLDVPTDSLRPQQFTFQGECYQQTVSIDLTTSIKTLAKQQDITLFAVLLTTLRILLYQWTQQADFVIGTVVSRRDQEQVKDLIGCFINFLALRNPVVSEQSLAIFLKSEQNNLLQAYQHQNCPFDQIVEAINPERDLAYNPIYNVALLFQNFPLDSSYDFGEGIQTELVEVNSNSALLDLRFLIAEKANRLEIKCEYNTDLFEDSTIQELVRNYIMILEKMGGNLDTVIAEIEISQALQQQAQKARARDKKQTLAISATFTADPLESSLNYWMEKLSLPSQIQFSPYNQVFQELLNPDSQINQNKDGFNTILIRPEDWVRFESTAQNWENQIQQASLELITILQSKTSEQKVPSIVILCPCSPHLSSEKIEFLNQIETLMINQLKPLKGFHLITSSEVNEVYPVADYYDSDRDQLGHIPYTELFYTVLGTAIARKIYALKHSPYKVIILDCDNTLWTGVCGEEGARGVIIDESRQALQTLLVAQQKAGKLLCLCSKNQEEDVWSVFDTQTQMPLKKEHLVSWKINWQPKSENIKVLAEELNLGLDSFIFIDDNPVECAEVRANCPEVLTLQLPENPSEIPQWLKHVWAFDLANTTEEDAQRTQMYQQERERDKLKQASLTFTDFLTSLNLDVSLEAITDDNLSRVSQLTQRTNQFNLTTIRRNEGEIRQLLEHEGLDGKIIKVKDRFGDYGLVGVVLFSCEEMHLTVDTLLLSCRVLGRGVEYEMVKFLGNLAQERKLTQIVFPYYPTAKNQPALDFLEKIGEDKRQSTEQGLLFIFTSEELLNIHLGVNDLSTETRTMERINPNQGLATQAPSELINQIPTQLASPERILQEIATHQQTQRLGQLTEYAEPRNEIEQQLASIWRNVLKMDRVGIYDNFFDLGGNSLLATQLLSEARKVFLMEFSLKNIFEYPSIYKMANYINSIQWVNENLDMELEVNWEAGEL